jgi:hypothetical protein
VAVVRSIPERRHPFLADVLVTFDAGERHVNIRQSGRIGVLFLGSLDQILGAAAKVIAVDLVTRRLDNLLLDLFADGDQFLGAGSDQLVIRFGDALQHLLRVL